MLATTLPTPTSTPTTPCRCCGVALDAKFQPGLGSRPSYWLLTCLNADCKLYWYTFGSPDYHEVDLAPYYESAGKKRNGG